ncbi:CHASE2 domain-containing protein [Desulfobacula phenolica]|uniref:Adenylate cyclase n=1 Tax=Desulfobacula phenolica TaxID=90732 RepID=A0A1H2JUR4_9BACT|nr:CHASE2 domain-containing protein [Desulfobacula phenolica]SDU60229.1 adenylate cyclase [Desulfobacula phenolica]
MNNSTANDKIPVYNFNLYHAIRPKNKRTALLFFLAGLFPTLIFTILCALNLPVFSSISLKIYDHYLWSSHNATTTGIPLIVDIDEKALKKYGQWPWSRFKVADLMEKINKDAPLAVGIDILFSEPDGTSLKNIYEDLSNRFDFKIKISEIPNYLHDNDTFLVNALAQGKFVPSIYLTFTGEKSSYNCKLHPLKVIVKYDKGACEDNLNLFKADGIVCNLPIFDDAVQMSGFINMNPDADGILRKAPLLMEYKGNIYPNLSLATLILALSPKSQVLMVSEYGVEGILLDKLFIPLDDHGYFPINFRGPFRSFEYVSAADILSDNIPQGKFQNKIVFIGTSAAGLKDNHHIPFDSTFPGVEVHANIADNILTENFLNQPHGVKVMEIAIVLITGLIVAFLFIRLNAGKGLAVFAIGGAGIFFGAQALFASNGIFISPLYPTMSLGLNFSIIYLLKYYISELRRSKREKEIAQMQEAIIEAIITVTETRDQETGGHIRRTQNYIKIMAEKLLIIEKYKTILTPEETDAICRAAPLHDVGKVGVSDIILLKPGKLTKEEFEEIKEHTTCGKKIIDSALNKAERNYFLETALDIAYTHHEKWDGSGYPQGISGEKIPFSGRLMAIADVYDALISRRPYKKPMKHEKAVDIIKEGRGTHFDPDLIDVFIHVHECFRKIAIEFAESEEDKVFLNNGHGRSSRHNKK